MTKILTAILLFAALVVVVPANAQEGTAKLELYGGYDYVRFNINANVAGFPPTATFNGYGGGGQLEYNANDWLGMVGDLAGYFVPTAGSHQEAFSYLFGPRLNLRRGKLTPFAQILFGGILASGGIGTSGPVDHYAMTAGGGLECRVSRLIAIRLAQAEYFMTKFPDGLNNRQDNFRFGTGVVFRFGS